MQDNKQKSSICLHLGYHKTASTYFQIRLRNNLKKLNSKGIHLYEPSTLRHNGFLKSFHRARKLISRPGHMKKLQKLKEELIDQSSYEHIIFSEENLLGFTNDPYKWGKFYPRNKSAANLLNRLFKEHDHTITIGIRDIAQQLTACYVETVKRKSEFITFEEFMKSLSFKKLNWTSLIKQVCKGLPNAKKITIYTQEALKDEQKKFQVFDSLTYVDTKKMLPHLSPAAINQSPPASYLDLLPKLVDSNLHPEDLLGITSFLSNRYRWHDKEKYDPFSQDIKDQLEKSYVSDLESIPKLDPRIELLRH